MPTQQTQNILYNICTASAQRLRRLANIVQMLDKCFLFTGKECAISKLPDRNVARILFINPFPSRLSHLNIHPLDVQIGETLTSFPITFIH